MEQREIRQWLKDRGRTKEWLAEHLCLQPSSVNQLLYSDRNVPARTEKMIRRLMDDDKENDLHLPNCAIVLSVPPDVFERFNRAALQRGMTISEWATDVLMSSSM